MRKLFLILFISFFLNGCNPANETSNRSTNIANSTKVVENTTYKNIFKAEIKAEPAAIKADEAVKFTLAVKNEKGETARDLQIVHEKPMHLIVVSEDLAEFYHIHPEVQTDGSLTVNFTFPNGGRYFLYADYTPKGASQIVDKLPVEVAGNNRVAVPLKADEKLEKTVESLRVVMKPDAELESNKEMMLDIFVTDAATNKPVTDLENYLGEKAHFVVISQDLKDFVHAHPMSNDNVKTEHSHNGNTEHKPEEKIMANTEMPTVSAHFTFPNSGFYKIFVEVKRGGKVLAIPFVVDVKKGKSEKVLTDVKIPDGYYKIVVSKDGFTPNEVSLSAEKGVKLAFIRVDADNCADEVVFRDLNITKKLPVGEVVTIEIPKGKTGDINFACGMDMMKGKVVIQ